MIKIGIDPAFRKNGFAMCIVDEVKEVRFKVFKNGFVDFINWLRVDAPSKAVFCVENSNMQKANFRKAKNVRTAFTMGTNVGKNQAISQCVVDALKQFYGSKSVLELSPKQKGAKEKDDNIINLIARSRKWKMPEKKYNQDERDAFKLTLFLDRF